MDVLISGKAGLAALITGDDASLINYDGEVMRVSSYADIARQFQSYDDALHIETTNRNEAIKKLKFESDKSDSLLILITLLDAHVPDDSKYELIKISDELLSREKVLSYVGGVMYSRPLENYAVEQVSNLNTDKESITLRFINDLFLSQLKVRSIYTGWHETALSYRADSDDLRYIEGVFVNNQAAYHLCKESIDNKLISIIKFNCLTQLKKIQNGRQILSALFNSVELKIIGSVNYGISSNQQDLESSKELATDRKNKSAKRKPVDIHKVYHQVTSQIKNIKQLLEKGDKAHALIFAETLLSSQLQRKDHEYAAMSLCHLSEFAKNIGDFSLQLEWAKMATDINPQDGRTYGHIADAYLNLGQLDNAYQNFRHCSKLGDLSFGNTGLARIERARYNYDRALVLVEESIQILPEFENLLLKAELYRDTYQLDKALYLYKQLMHDYPDRVTPMCGYAAVLTDQRQFEKSEAQWREAVMLYPSDQVAASGLGFLLARQGHFKEAIKYLDIGIKNKRKMEYIPLLAKAKALRIAGDNSGATKIYNEVIESNIYIVDPWLELIEMFSNAHEFKTARNYLERANNKFPHNSQFYLLEALIFKNEGNYIEALNILDKLKSSHPRWIKVLTERANTLKALAYLDDARSQYMELLSFNPHFYRAKVGIRLLDALEGKKDIHIEEPRKKDNSSGPMVLDDWDQVHMNGLLLLALDRPKEAKKVLLEGHKKNPFDLMKEKFAVSLAVARNSLGQYGTALKSIKNINTNHALMQKIIVKGELGHQEELGIEIDRLRSISSNRERVVLNLLEARYLRDKVKSEAERPELSQIVSEEIRSMLLAA